MTVDDRTRMELHRRLTEVLGDQEADTLMAHLPPVTWQNVATTDSVDSTRVVLATQIDALRSDVDRQITELRSDLNGHVTALNSALSTGLSDLRAEMHRTTRSIVVLVAALTTAAVALGGILT